MNNNNYNVIVETIDNILYELYSEMEKYMENIFNAPSTINKILTYYALGFNPAEPTKRFIMFGGKIIREYEIILSTI